MLRNKRKLGLFLIICILLSSLVYQVQADTEAPGDGGRSPQAEEILEAFEKTFDGITYREYLNRYQEMGDDGSVTQLTAFGSDRVTIPAESYTEYIGTKRDNPEMGIYTDEDSFVSWEFEIKESGMYNIGINYLPTEGNGNDIERNLWLDGEIPFQEAKFMTFTRVWADAGEIQTDNNGNDIRPKQIEVPEWRKSYLYDATRHYNEPLQFYLEKGTHKIALEAVREPVIISELYIEKAEEIPEYAQVKKEYEEKAYKTITAEPIKLQAEHTYKKSDYTLYPAMDRSSALTEPQDPAKVKLNSISGQKYKLPGQWITWKVTVPETGLYKIAFRYKQNILSGLYTSRKLLIDGVVPFKEAEHIRFNYSDAWEIKALGEEEDFLFYLTKGEHDITLEVTLGDLAPVITEVSDSLVILNEIYRKILMITGPEPDQYRDYSFERQIPQVLELMKEQAEVIRQVSAKMEEIVQGKGEQMAALDKVGFQLERMYKDPEKIATTFTSFKDNIAALATWVLTVSEQPLSLDYIYFSAADEPLPKAEAGFFTSLSYEVKSLVMSFFVDYNSLGLTLTEAEEKEIESIEVWITSGRDQVSILREMINDSFTPQTNIRVDLKLVDEGTLLPSVLAGVGPDVSLGNKMGEPIQYAIRNALINLNQFDNYEDVVQRFHHSAMTSYTFEGNVYALPETQTFHMMFYRKDIFEDLGLSIPDTWEEFYALIPELQKNNMEIGFPSGLTGMQMFLYQNGGSLYSQDFSATTLDKDLTIDAFQQLCELFTTYKFPRDFDFANRFRTGQMPLGIQDYTIYNNLTAFAPEIKGLWEFAPLPGTLKEDGTIDRSAPVDGTCAVILKGTKNPEASWEFLKWWTSTESQARFAKEMEAVLGKAAKHATANMEAMQSLPWTQREYQNLMEQWRHLTGTPEIPGGYYVSRSVDFAASRAYITGDGEILIDYARDANKEITRKRKEFGIK